MDKISKWTGGILVAFLFTCIANIDAQTAVNVRTGDHFSDLQTAINSSQQNDVLNLYGTFTVTSSSFNNNQNNLTLNGVKNAVLDGNQVDTVFSVNDPGVPVNVIFSNLVIQNGSAASGGGISNASDTKNTIILKNVTVLNNSAYDGGGIYNNGHLLLENSKVIFNQANGTGGAGIHVENSNASVAASNSEISYNTFTGANGGGALYANIGEGSASFSFYKTKIQGNTSSNAGGGFYFGNAVAQFVKCEIEKNTSLNDGGGFYITNSALVFADSKIEKNTATGAIVFGGGIYASGSELKIFDSKVKMNSAEIGGGLAFFSTSLQMFSSEIEKNIATAGGGGGLFLGNNSTVYLGHVEIEKNKAANGDGGGVYNPAGSLILQSCQIKENSANGNGGGIFSDNITGLIATSVTCNKASDGGGIYNDIDAVLTLTNSEVKHNDPDNISNNGTLYD